ncbi:MucBP domain-containing protein [Aerococcus tenax]|uniref:MucBP domain-containing protein n=1 Tax=Aerococcus tenax TaxID=3078812 RepID=UPI0018A7DA23|nr:MucBP domain-containing protein [Aerococcus tenax]
MENFERKQRFSIRKLSVGVGSVLIATLLFAQSATVYADEISNTENKSAHVGEGEAPASALDNGKNENISDKVSYYSADAVSENKDTDKKSQNEAEKTHKVETAAPTNAEDPMPTATDSNLKVTHFVRDPEVEGKELKYAEDPIKYNKVRPAKLPETVSFVNSDDADKRVTNVFALSDQSGEKDAYYIAVNTNLKTNEYEGSVYDKNKQLINTYKLDKNGEIPLPLFGQDANFSKANLPKVKFKVDENGEYLVFDRAEDWKKTNKYSAKSLYAAAVKTVIPDKYEYHNGAHDEYNQSLPHKTKVMVNYLEVGTKKQLAPSQEFPAFVGDNYITNSSKDRFYKEFNKDDYRLVKASNYPEGKINGTYWAGKGFSIVNTIVNNAASVSRTFVVRRTVVNDNGDIVIEMWDKATGVKLPIRNYKTVDGKVVELVNKEKVKEEDYKVYVSEPIASSVAGVKSDAKYIGVNFLWKDDKGILSFSNDGKTRYKFNDMSKGQRLSYWTSGWQPAGKEITYWYELINKPKGSFQEHHVYRTVDKNGNVISEDSKEDGKTTEGKSSETYTTSKKDKPGYKLVKIEGKNGGKFDKNGAESKANYVDNTKQEVTYIYEKVQEEKGSFQEHHIYRTVDKNGNVISEDSKEDGKITEGKSDETYTTSKKDKPGYKLVKVEGKNGSKFDKNGGETKGNYVGNTKQEVTYIYEKVQEEKGSFQEHHIYRTVDKNGNVISVDSKEDGKTTEGKSSDHYTTSKKDKAGYKLVKVEGKNGGKFDKNGAESKANYVDNIKQEVTYIYEKVKEEKGSFQEHHIYRTVDKNGNVISEDYKEDGKTTEGKSSDQYTTSKKDKAGYKLVKIEGKNGGKFDKNGAESKGNYVDNTKQEVTYIYEKVQEEKGSFQEHHIYRTVDKNGNVISEDSKEDGKITEGKSDETYTTSKKDKPGYKLVKVEGKNGGQFDKNGSETKGNYVDNTKQEVTYIYEKVQEEKGSFQEHHIYRTVDKNGNVISEDSKEDGKTTEGKSYETYSTSKKDKAGYKLVKIEGKNGGQFDKDGAETKGNYVDNTKQEVTYIYEKVQEEKGFFQEHHIYRTVDKNGNVLSTDEVSDGDTSEGKSDELYTTSKKDKAGYKLVKIEGKNGGKFAKNGSETKANYVDNTKQEVTYVYERVQEEKGSFQEHHIYRTVDKNGNVLSVDSKEDGKTTEGKSSDQYTTSKKDKAGYKLVKIEGKNGGKFAKNGSEIKGNYVDNTKQEVTYIYEKVKEEKSSFQEHHIYRTVDKNGNVLSVDSKEDGKTTEGKSSDQYTTSKKDKAGYKLVKIEGKNGGQFDKDGAETKGNYVDNTKQEVTYIYEKVQEEKGSFQEHHIYRTVDKNGNVLSTDEVSDGDTTEGKSDELYTTSKKDKAGYKLVKIEAKNGGKFDKNGAESKANYVDNIKQEVTYVYERVQEEKGSFQEHHIYRTVDKNGNVISEDSKEDGKITEGKSDETYSTSKKDKPGYKLVKIEGKNGGQFDKNGGETKGNYVGNTKQEVTYLYERVQEEKGSFQEHHIYRTVDKNGNVISVDSKEDGKTTEGKSDELYTTSKKDKAGYKLVKIEGKNGGHFAKNGGETKVNYVDNTKQEVTYIYERVQEEKGSFQEHHIYRTVDKNGNVILVDFKEDGKTTEGKSSETYTTSKKDKPGYKLVKIEGKNGGQFDKNGSEIKGNYVDNTKQEVTYIYERVQKGLSQEYPITQTSHKNGKVTLINKTVKIPGQETPVVKNQEKDAVLLETSKENSKKDKVDSLNVSRTVEKESETHQTAEKVASSLPKTGAIAPSLLSEVFGFALTFAGFRVFKKRKF